MGAEAVGILGLGVAIPDRVVPNSYFEGILDTSDEWIRTRTGIRERRFVEPGTATSDLAIRAARAALADAGLAGGEVDLIVVATTTPDHAFPPTACLVQHALGAPAAAFDLSAACSGWLYGVRLAESAIRAGGVRHALVIGAEVLSSIINWKDRGTAVLIGDGAGAAVLGAAPGGRGIRSFVWGADGSGFDLIIQPSGGSRLPATAETVEQGLTKFAMKGREVYRWAVSHVGEVAEEALRLAGRTAADVDLFVPHQANHRILTAAAERLDFPLDRVWINIDRYGNISNACIPVALYEAREAGRLRPGDTLLTVAFGGGLTWAGAVMDWV
jgi:3-oxoacyl-[acyl-carrier-protein] synthase-3